MILAFLFKRFGSDEGEYTFRGFVVKKLHEQVAPSRLELPIFLLSNVSLLDLTPSRSRLRDTGSLISVFHSGFSSHHRLPAPLRIKHSFILSGNLSNCSVQPMHFPCPMAK